MNLQPLDDRIVVKPGESEETTASGLVLPGWVLQAADWPTWVRRAWA